MIAHIQGRLVEKTPTEVIIDCNGVGYHINISLHTYSLLPDSESLKLFTFLQIREDAHTLYGFVEKQERELFKLLLSVSGVGASTARTMLSSLAPSQIIQAIASNDVGTMQSMKGKVLKVYNLDEVSVIESNTNKDEALSALEVLGFVRKSAEKVIDKIIRETPNASVENLIKQALKNL
jgi:Holliday junction DNA helicase RuvA